MIDKDIINKHLKELNSIIDQLVDLKKYNLSELENELKKLWEVEHGLQLAIQNILDIGGHILASQGINTYDNYTDIIDILGKKNIISLEFSKKIRGMSGLRNILVHDYIKVDIMPLYNILQNQLSDFYDFVRYIITYLDSI